ncbi:hypothetical protein R3P38DRAFT_3128692 [Favolaschia claudopus]|uniref:Uncharacterized protein n=1 Tax=Favolaschia claudopus TaxID=2862362 RepID=A0AAV9ZAH7_9AGAR
MNMALTNDTTDDSDSDSESNVPDLVSDDDTPNGHGGHGSQSTPGPINAMTRNMQALTIALTTTPQCSRAPLVGRDITPADAFYRFPNRLVHRALQDAIESNAHVVSFLCHSLPLSHVAQQGRVRTNIRRLHRGGQYYRATAHARASTTNSYVTSSPTSNARSMSFKASSTTTTDTTLVTADSLHPSPTADHCVFPDHHRPSWLTGGFRGDGASLSLVSAGGELTW